MPYEVVRARLVGDPGEAFWLAARGPIAPVIEDAAFLAEAATKLPAGPWDETTWKTWTSGLAVSSGRKGRALFHPLRLALTARATGPEMAKLLPLIGRTRVQARPAGRTA